MKPRYLFSFLVLITLFVLSGCGVAAVDGTATHGVYKGATDERSIGTIFNDSVISTTAKSRMISDEFVKARYIDVAVLNGVVYLTGIVESSAQKRMAADIARGVEGVRRIENQLAVEKSIVGQAAYDAMLKGKIKAELLKDPDI